MTKKERAQQRKKYTALALGGVILVAIAVFVVMAIIAGGVGVAMRNFCFAGISDVLVQEDEEITSYLLLETTIAGNQVEGRLSTYTSDGAEILGPLNGQVTELPEAIVMNVLYESHQRGERQMQQRYITIRDNFANISHGPQETRNDGVLVYENIESIEAWIQIPQVSCEDEFAEIRYQARNLAEEQE